MYWLMVAASVLAGAIAFVLVVFAYQVPKKKIGMGTKLRRSPDSVAWRLALAVLFAILAWWAWPSTAPASLAPTETEDPLVAPKDSSVSLRKEDSSLSVPSIESKNVPPKADSGVKALPSEEKMKPVPPVPKSPPKPAPGDMSNVANVEKQTDTTTVWWRHWGARPYASSYASVCKNMPATINGFRRMPEAVKQEFIQLLGRECAGGEEIYITPSMSFWEMWTGGAKPYPMQNVKVSKVPVSHSPEGRKLREVFQTARGVQWTLEHEGRTYTLVIPYVCHNVAYMVSESDCVTISFDTHIGSSVYWFVGSAEGPLPPDKCNAIQQGTGEWKAWYGECPSCEPGLDWMRQTLGEMVTVPHRYMYRVTHKEQKIRFSKAIWSRGVQICLEVDGKKSCGLGIAPGNTALAWNDRSFIWIDWSLWKWNNNCFQ